MGFENSSFWMETTSSWGNIAIAGQATPPKIKKVIHNRPATIVIWADGTKTVVKAQNGETYDGEKGIAMAFMKKVYGNKGKYFNDIKKWEETEETETEELQGEQIYINLTTGEFSTVPKRKK